MGSVLENGLYLPDEGERNAYDGLKGNWNTLDNLVETVTALSSTGLIRKPVDALPITDIQTNVIYLLKATKPNGDVYRIEYMYIDDHWDAVGTSETTLDDYYTKTETDDLPAVKSGINATKVSNYDTHIADTDIHVTLANKQTWDGKQNALDTAQTAAVNSGVTGTKVTGYDNHVSDTDIHVTAADKTAWNGKQDGLSQTQLAAVNSGITDTKVTGYDTHVGNSSAHVSSSDRTAWNGKQDALTQTQLDNIATIPDKANSADLATVATSGSYTDLINAPTIPTVNNATLTIQKNGTDVATFTANASSNVTANLLIPTDTSDLTNGAGFLTQHNPIDNELSATSENALQNKVVKSELDGKAPLVHTHAASDITSGTFNIARIPNLDASKITSGTIDIARLPKGSLERLIKVANQAARYALTTDDVQLGDTVQQLDTGVMYVVTDETKLDSADGYTEFTAGSASSVPWSGVTGKPADYTPASHSHGNITNDGKVGTAANKPLITGTDGVVQAGAFGNSANTFCEGNDSRLSDARTPTSHAHGSITNDGKLANGNKVVITNSSKVITESSVTDTELGYLSGVTSAIQTQISGKANASHTHSASDITSGLATVATSGSYNDLSNKPTIPTVNNATLTIQKNGSTVKTFTANASSNVTANITVPTKVSELTNDSGFLTAHQSLSNYSTLANTVKSLSISGKTITVTPGSGSAYTLTTQDTVYTHPTTSGNKHIPSGGSSGQFLGWDSDGTAKWVNNPNSDTLMTQNVSTTNATYPLLLCPTANATANQGAKTGIFAKSVKVNPSTNALSATQLWSNSQTIQNSGFTKGTNPSAQSYWSMYMADKNGNDWATNCLGVFETTCDTSGNVTSVMKAVKNEANSGNAGAISVTYNKSANTVSTYAPTPATSSNDTNIATTAFVKAQGYITSSSNITGTSANVTGTVAIANGGTGATSRLNAVKNLTNENVGTGSQYFLTITSNWGKAGYCSVADAKTVLSVPTKTSQLTNDSGFLTSHQSLSNYVTLDGSQTISGNKTFSSNLVYTNTLAKKHSSVTKGTNPSSTAWWTIGMCDKNGLNAANNGLGMFETSLAADGNVSTYLRAYKNTAGSTTCSEVRAKYNTTNDIGWINCTGEDICLISNKKKQGTVPTANQDCTFKMFDNSSHTLFEIRNRSVANSSANQTYTTISVAPNTSGAGVTDAFRIYAQTENSSTVCNVLTQTFLPISNNTYNLGDNSHKWKTAHAVNFYENGTALTDKYVQINQFTNENISLSAGVGTIIFAAGLSTQLVLGQHKTISAINLHMVSDNLLRSTSNGYVNYISIQSTPMSSGTWTLLTDGTSGVADAYVLGYWKRTS